MQEVWFVRKRRDATKRALYFTLNFAFYFKKGKLSTQTALKEAELVEVPLYKLPAWMLSLNIPNKLARVMAILSSNSSSSAKENTSN